MVIYSEGKWISSACIKKGLPYADTLPYADKQKMTKYHILVIGVVLAWYHKSV